MPAALGQPGPRVMRARRLRALREAPAREHEPPSATAVPTHPVENDPYPARALRVDIDPLDLYGTDDLRRDFALELATAYPTGQAPILRPGAAVLRGHGDG